MPVKILCDEEDASESLTRLHAELMETWKDRNSPKEELRIVKRTLCTGTEVYYATLYFGLLVDREVECRASNDWVQWYVRHKDWDPLYGSQHVAVTREMAIRVIDECMKQLEEFYDGRS
jgi:hypothetical protein